MNACQQVEVTGSTAQEFFLIGQLSVKFPKAHISSFDNQKTITLDPLDLVTAAARPANS
jgi:hypothetical protein